MGSRASWLGTALLTGACVSSPHPSDEPNLAIVDGVVLDAHLGSPVEGAQLEFFRNSFGVHTYATSDASGLFELEVLDDEPGLLIVHAAHYVTYNGGVVGSAASRRWIEVTMRPTSDPCAEVGRDRIGVAARLDEREDGTITLSPSPSRPSSTHVPLGFELRYVDGRDIDGLRGWDVAPQLLGDPGTEVVLTGVRPGTKKLEDIVLSRRRFLDGSYVFDCPSATQAYWNSVGLGRVHDD